MFYLVLVLTQIRFWVNWSFLERLITLALNWKVTKNEQKYFNSENLLKKERMMKAKECNYCAFDAKTLRTSAKFTYLAGCKIILSHYRDKY